MNQFSGGLNSGDPLYLRRFPENVLFQFELYKEGRINLHMTSSLKSQPELRRELNPPSSL